MLRQLQAEDLTPKVLSCLFEKKSQFSCFNPQFLLDAVGATFRIWSKSKLSKLSLKNINTSYSIGSEVSDLEEEKVRLVEFGVKGLEWVASEDGRGGGHQGGGSRWCRLCSFASNSNRLHAVSCSWMPQQLTVSNQESGGLQIDRAAVTWWRNIDCRQLSDGLVSWRPTNVPQLLPYAASKKKMERCRRLG